MAKLKTGRHTSALKAARQALRRKTRNTATHSSIKNLVKKVESAVAAKDTTTAQKTLKNVFSAWDKAVKKKIIHKNASSNQKARLSKLVAALPAQS